MNVDPNQPSELVEYTVPGKAPSQFVGQFAIDANNGGAFGIALNQPAASGFQFAAVDDNGPSVLTWGTAPLPTHSVALGLSLTPSVSTVSLGQKVSFAIQVTNTGTAGLPADTTAITLALSQGLSATRSLSFNVGALAVGQSESFTVVATATATGDQMATATLTSPDATPATSMTTVTVTAPSPNLVGFSQFAVGSDSGRPSTVHLFNSDGTLANALDPFPGTTGGVRVAVGDFNGDGTQDVAVGTGPGGQAEVKILDGKTGGVLFDVRPFESFTGGVFVAAADVTGDGVSDRVITPDLNGGPRVELYKGGDFQEIANFFGIDDPNFRGGARAALGDLNGDGKSDLAISAGFGGGPRISIYDGAALAAGQQVHLVNDFFLFEPTLRNGAYVAIGDVDGDGFGDLIGGAGPGGGPRVLVISRKTMLESGSSAAIASPVANFFAGDVNNRGGIRVASKNLDGDKNADLLVWEGTGSGSHVTTYLGKDLSIGVQSKSLDFDAFPGFNGGVFVG